MTKYSKKKKKASFRLFVLPLEKTLQHENKLWRLFGTKKKEVSNAVYKNKLENQTHMVEIDPRIQHYKASVCAKSKPVLPSEVYKSICL